MTAQVWLPQAGGDLVAHQLSAPAALLPAADPLHSRVAFAAAHVVADPFSDSNVPGGPAVLDWDATLAFRQHLWSHGLGVAEAMDTAQRGMGLDWPTAAELIRRSAAEARACGGRIAAGVGTDQAPASVSGLGELTAAYLEQLELVEQAGAQPILMCSRQLARLARGPQDYYAVYSTLLRQAGQPVILHWLGAAFDPALAGYWGSDDVSVATGHFLELIREYSSIVDGVKVSLLDAEHEVGLRAALPPGVRCYTGDDFHYPELIAGGSDALLGIFDAIAPAAAAALRALDAGRVEEFHRLLEPTVPLSRHVFSAPTFHYKTGIVFLAWLAGHQSAFTMVGGMQSARGLVHLGQTLRLADAAGLLPDPDLAAARWGALLTTAGVVR